MSLADSAMSDQVKTVASNMLERVLTTLDVINQSFVPPIIQQPQQSRIPQHLHHVHALSSEAKSSDFNRSASPPPAHMTHLPSQYYSPLWSGWSWMQKNAGKWKKVWCEYTPDGQFAYRIDESARRANGSLLVSYADVERADNDPPTNLPAPPVLSHSFSSPPAHSTSAAAIPTSPSLSRPPALTISTSAVYPPPSPPPLDVDALAISRLSLYAPATPTTSGVRGSSEYATFLASLDPNFTFRIFTDQRTYYFRAETEDARTQLISTIRTHILSNPENGQLWLTKQAAVISLAVLMQEQFMLQIHRYNLLMRALAKQGFMEDELPITSTRKEKSGVLAMETVSEGINRWRDYYFVLFEGALFYYKDSKSTTPTGFITLKYAAVTIVPSKLAQSDFLFHVITPLRTITCRTKHAVALTEWIVALAGALASHRQKNGRTTSAQSTTPHAVGQNTELSRSFDSGKGEHIATASASSLSLAADRDKGKSVLQSILDLISDTNTFNSLISNPIGLEAFRKYLAEEGAGPKRHVNAFEFYMATSEYASSLPNVAELLQPAQQIFDRFFRPSSAEYMYALTDEVIDNIESQLSTPTLNMFDGVRRLIIPLITADYFDFKRTPEYSQLSEVISQQLTADNRQVEPFDTHAIQQFQLKVKGQKRSKEIKLENRRTLHTIGRDKSNSLVIEDSRVSRSHARLEYSASHCEYIDLGSSCGSKLNGRPVLRSKLRSGDVIELGQSILIFQVKKRKSRLTHISQWFGGSNT